MKFVASVAFTDPRHLCELARTADACGYHGIVVSDHLVHPEKLATPYPYTPDGAPRWGPEAPWPDPWVAIGAMAAVTERLRFYTGVYVLPLRSPFAVAKAVGTAARMSGGRVSLGVGAGWMREEFELLGQPFGGRGRRMDEMIEVLRKLWAGGMVEHHGEFYDFGRLRMSPAPDAPIPILVGGLSAPALRRVGRLADGWISDLHTTEELREIVGRIRRYRAEYGREREPLEIVAACSDAAGADGYRRLEELGVTHLLTMPWLLYGGRTDSLDAKREGLLRFAEDVFPKLR
jgi:probable F420-dependent oxidoreductase